MKPQNKPFNEILTLIYSAKQKAFAQVNSTLIELYWSVGQYISTKTTKENWGKSVVKELAEYIKDQEPNLSGFTARNLWRMKQFYEIYNGNEKVSALLTQLIWTNHLLIISSSKSDEEREFYLLLAGQAKYSSRVEYLSEYIDLLFYHRDLKCLVAFELKIGKFKPSDLGQLEFYLEALDRDVKREDENPSIGVLLCRKKNDEVVKYALSRSLSPTVISEYETKLIPKELLRQKLNEIYEVYDLRDEEIGIVENI